MFHTLKGNGQSDEPYTFETTTPPFSKKRESKLVKVACINCRMSKLKCSGEPYSCQRCLAKQVKCDYPSLARSHIQRKAPSLPETPKGNLPPAVVEEAADSDSVTVASNRESTTNGNFNDSSPIFEIPNFATPRDIDISEYVSMMRPLEQQPFNLLSNTNGEPWDEGLELEYFDLNTGNSSFLTEAPSMEKTGENCSCFARAVRTHEAIEVVLWGQKQLSSDADNLLQDQKKLLIECEGLLECQKCKTQPAYIMLLISMCNKLLETFKDMCSDDPAGDSGEAISIKKVEQVSEKRKRKSLGNGDNRGTDHRRYSVRIWSRPLDDDDERLVLQSLFTARLSRLGRLLNMLDRVVSQHSWPAHKALLRELQLGMEKEGSLL